MVCICENDMPPSSNGHATRYAECSTMHQADCMRTADCHPQMAHATQVVIAAPLFCICLVTEITNKLHAHINCH